MSSKRYANWLHKESQHWIADGLIDADQANRIRQRYPEPTGWSWGLYLLSALGAVVFGLGVVLFFAYNWSELHKYAKLAIVFGSLLCAHLLALFYGRNVAGASVINNTVVESRASGNRNLTEGFHLLGTMMFGAGIWLIAQIYHIDEHYPTAFALWGLAALAMAWVMPSVLQGLLATVLLTVWGIAEISDFRALHILSVVSIVFGIIGLAFLQRSRTLLFFGLGGALIIAFVNMLTHAAEQTFVYVIFSTAILLIVACRLCRFTSFVDSVPMVRGFGIVIYAVLLFLLSFDSLTDDFFEPITNDIVRQYVVGLLAFSAICWGAYFYDSVVSGQTLFKILEMVLVSIVMLTMLASLFWFSDKTTALTVLIINAVLALHCVLLIIMGTSALNWRHVAIGCFTLLVQVVSRFNDLFESLLMRSLVFLIVGAVLFFIGHIHSKSNARKRGVNQENLATGVHQVSAGNDGASADA